MNASLDSQKSIGVERELNQKYPGCRTQGRYSIKGLTGVYCHVMIGVQKEHAETVGACPFTNTERPSRRSEPFKYF